MIFEIALEIVFFFLSLALLLAFYRFLKGWSPRHWKIHRYSERLAHQVIRRLQADS